MKRSLILFTLLLMATAAIAQNFPDTLREFRGVWVATTKRIDYPQKATTDANTLKSNYITLLSQYKNAGYNAVVFQVRPAADAFFKSPYEPWSEWLTGKQGRAPVPEFDPLTFMVERTHAQKMEFHAWFNPFRAVATTQYADVCANHISNTKPEWFFSYGGSKYFDPGIPEVREYLIKVIVDVVKRYDIDGVHFDDYFYPYPVQGDNKKFIELPDDKTFQKYKGNFTDKAAWRRNNVNVFIRDCNAAIKKEKAWIKFGVGPAGVWRNKREDPDGSETNSLSAYDYLYADVLTWLKNGWIDYAAPQIYWNINHQYNQFEKCVRWWDNHAYGRNIYIGLGAYNQENGGANGWNDPNEIPNQINITRKYPNVQGIITYRSTTITKNPMNMVTSVKQKCFNRDVMMPKMPWLENSPNSPEATIIKAPRQYVVHWTDDKQKTLPADDTPVFYAIYRVKGKNPDFVPSQKNFLKFTDNCDLRLFHKGKAWFRKKFYTYKITSFNRYHVESAPSKAIIIKYSKKDRVE